MQAKMVPVVQIKRDNNNPRSEPSDEQGEALRTSIQAHGIKVPLLAFDEAGTLVLLDGHCRLDVALDLGMKEVPVVVFPCRPSEADMLLTQLTINTHRHSLNPDDEYEAFARLSRLKKWSPSELAVGLAVSNAEVTRVLAIGNLSDEERKLVREGKLSKSAAYALSRMEPNERNVALQKAVAGQVTRDQLNRQARRKAKTDEVKTQRIRCDWGGASVSVQAAAGLTLAGLIDLLESLMRECKKARTQGLDIDTTVRVLRDRSRSQVATSEAITG